MAQLTVNIEAIETNVALVTGSFTGGDDSYSYSRFLRIDIDGWGSTDVYSDQQSGGYNTFNSAIGFFEPGTTYTWTATLYYRTTGGWAASNYTASGSFKTPGVFYGRIIFAELSSTGAQNILDDLPIQYKEQILTLDLSRYAPSKDGYSFKGWATSPGSTTVSYAPNSQLTITLSKTPPGPTVTLWAVWATIKPTIISAELSDDGKYVYLYITPGDRIQGKTCYVEGGIYNWDISSNAIQTIDLGRQAFGTTTKSYALTAPTDAGLYEIGIMFTDGESTVYDSASASFTVGSSGAVRIFTGTTNPVKATPYIWNGGWKKAVPYVWNNGWKKGT